jgi:ornithine decarboxylase
MTLIRPPAAHILPSVADLVARERPEAPIYCLRPAVIAAAAGEFVAAFPGRTLYAVKCNPEPLALRAIWDGGVRHFDCASLAEVALVRDLFPQAGIHFMHPVKARGAIRAAWAQHGVRDFAFDTPEELAKILAETATGPVSDRGLILRLALGKGVARHDLSGKFGAAPEAAAALLRAARPHAARLGVTFHVGSQCLDPLAWRRAIALAGEVVREAGVPVEVLDVGGGFPVAYPDQSPPPLGAFFAEIEAAFEALDLPEVALWAEPGRALVAAGGSIVLQVQQRRDGGLFVNDGVYGALSDAGAPGFRFPTRLLRPGGQVARIERDFALFGPTCDSADVMRGPFRLPADTAEGDWIELGQLGAYAACLATPFNGFAAARVVAVPDRPLPVRHDAPPVTLAA